LSFVRLTLAIVAGLTAGCAEASGDRDRDRGLNSPFG
jgi:hypothetical protein